MLLYYQMVYRLSQIYAIRHVYEVVVVLQAVKKIEIKTKSVFIYKVKCVDIFHNSQDFNILCV